MPLCLPHNMLTNPLRPAAIPRDLDSITSIDDKLEVPAQESGLEPGAAEAIWKSVQDLYRARMHPLIGICVRHRGKVLLNRVIGYQRGDAADPEAVVAGLDTPICQFSAAKAVTAMLVHLLAEQGEIHLLDPISYYIPAYAARGKGNTTIYQLLAHRAGVPGLGEKVEASILLDRAAIIERICASEPLDSHGRTQAYHALTGGFIIEELIRVTTGLSIQQYLDRYIRKPMGMRYFRYGLAKRDLPKVAENRNTGPRPGRVIGGTLEKVLGLTVEEAVELSNNEMFQTAVIPSANIYSTAEEASRFYQMLLDYGRYGEQQILQPLTVHRALQEAGRAQLDASLKMPMRYSAGFMLGGSPMGMYGPDTQHAFGHLGLSNVLCWADPAREISVGLLTSGKPIMSNHLVGLFRMLFAIARECPPGRDLHGAAGLWRVA